MSMNDLYKMFDQTVRDITREVNKTILKVPEIEQKTLDATSNEPWGPHGQLMNDLARATRTYHEYQMIMGILWKRIQDTGANWRHVYKSLLVMDFLVANGSERVIDELRDHMYQLQSLTEFEYVEPNGKDQGINVRKKAQGLVALLKDTEKIREAREKAAANRNKYRGISSSALSSGSFGSDSHGGSRDRYEGFGSGGGGGGGSYRDRRDDFSFEGGDKYGGSRGRERYGGGGEDEFGRERRSRGGSRYEDDYEGRQGKGRGSYGGEEEDDRGRAGYTSAGGVGGGGVQSYDDEFGGRKGGSSLQDDDDFDDFDPRGKPAAAAAAAPVKPPAPAPVPTPAAAIPAPVNFMDDLFGDPIPAPAPAAAAAPPVQAPVDLFGDAVFQSAAVPSQAAAPPAAFAAFAPAPATSAADDFGAFAAAPSAPAPAPAPAPAAAPAAADPFAAFQSAPTPAPALAQPQGAAGGGIGSFAAKPSPYAAAPASSAGSTGLWADALSSGLIDLNISTPKEEPLSSVGIMPDAAQMKTADSSSAFSLHQPYMGRAMGAGSGMGIQGASGLTPPPPPATAAQAQAMGGMSFPVGVGMMPMSPVGGAPLMPSAVPGTFPGSYPAATAPGVTGMANPGFANFGAQQPLGGVSSQPAAPGGFNAQFGGGGFM